jgi:hypothetical protein
MNGSEMFLSDVVGAWAEANGVCVFEEQLMYAEMENTVAVSSFYSDETIKGYYEELSTAKHVRH